MPGLAREWVPCDPGDLIGPGIAVDENAQLKDGDATACVAPPQAGCTGHVEMPHHGVLRVGFHVRAGLGGLRCVHAGALGD